MGVRRVARPCRDEKGIFIVLWALVLLAILTMVAIVIDIGQMRAVRRTNKSMTDFAALAAGPGIALSNPRGACKEGLKNLRANALEAALETITQAEIDTTCGNPAAPPASPGAGLPLVCPDPLPATSPSRTLVKGDYTIRIYYPVLDGDIADPRLPGGLGLQDGTACQRLKVEITQTATPTFAKAIGVSQQTSTVSSVIKGAAVIKLEKVAALLVLERVACEALWTSGQGNVLVKEAGPDDPGILHADSLATSGCTTGGPSQRFVIYGTQVPFASGNPRAGQPSIQVAGNRAPACPGPGAVTSRGFVNMVVPFSSRSASVVDSGVCPGPTGGVLTGRSFHDNRWNPTTDPARTRTINTLRAAAVDLTTADPAMTLAQELRSKGYVVYPDDVNADPLVTPPVNMTPTPPVPFTDGCTTNTPYEITNPRVFINCAPLNAAALTFTGTHFVTAGALNVGANRTLRFPNATQLFVTGCSGTCTSNNASASGIDITNGSFTVNDGTATQCVNTSTPALPDRTGTSVTPAQVVVLKGRFRTAGSGAGNDSVVRMCQTTLYLAQEQSPWTNRTSSPDVSCQTVSCPKASDTLTGDIKITAKVVDWSAPNQSSTDPAADGPPGPFEDLALWTEAGGSGDSSFNNDSSLGGNSSTSTSGVFFMPNALFTFTGNTGINQEFNAQFVARRLNLNGQGALTMLPNPNDAVPTPFPSWQMIR